MPKARVTRNAFLEDRQGIKFVDVVNDPEQPFDSVLAFFNDADRQRRMEESELHHDRAPLAGVVRELESQPDVDRFLTGVHARRSTRLRQAIGVVVRMIMEHRGWQKTGFVVSRLPVGKRDWTSSDWQDMWDNLFARAQDRRAWRNAVKGLSSEPPTDPAAPPAAIPLGLHELSHPSLRFALFGGI